MRPEIIQIGPSDSWPEGISDGLSLHCPACGERPQFDYLVTNEIWNAVVPKEWRLGVVCLPCLDRLAHHAGVDISEGIESVQFTGLGKTVEMAPRRIVRYPIRR